MKFYQLPDPRFFIDESPSTDDQRGSPEPWKEGRPTTRGMFVQLKPTVKVRHAPAPEFFANTWTSLFGVEFAATHESLPAPVYSPTPSIPITIPLISEILPRHHTPALLGTGVPSVL